MLIVWVVPDGEKIAGCENMVVAKNNRADSIITYLKNE